ncbi:MAG: hypothetical protein ACHREM_11410 [Polyangiales bacterium]
MKSDRVTDLSHLVHGVVAELHDWEHRRPGSQQLPQQHTELEHPNVTAMRLGIDPFDFPLRQWVSYPIEEGDVLAHPYNAFAFGWCEISSGR